MGDAVAKAKKKEADAYSPEAEAAALIKATESFKAAIQHAALVKGDRGAAEHEAKSNADKVHEAAAPTPEQQKAEIQALKVNGALKHLETRDKAKGFKPNNSEGGAE